jgi:hypothetical protein
VLQSFGEGVVAQEIEVLIEWLQLFHPLSYVELDYGGLAGYLDTTLKAEGLRGIEDDGSIEDVIFSLAGLAAGDGAIAGEGYERLVRRWRQRSFMVLPYCQVTPFSPILPDIKSNSDKVLTCF